MKVSNNMHGLLIGFLLFLTSYLSTHFAQGDPPNSKKRDARGRAANRANIPQPKNKSKTIGITPVTFDTEPIVPRFLTVNSDPDIPDPKTAALHKKMAAFLTQAHLDAPAERIQHFRWLNKNPDFLFRGWYAMITKIHSDADGTFVVLRVTPRISGPIHVNDEFFEKYAVVNDTIKCVGFDGPLPTDNPDTMR